MSVFHSFGKGFSTANHRIRLLIYLWLFNFLFSVIIVTPFYLLINQDFSRSLARERLVRGFDLVWLGDVINKYQDVLPALLGWMLVPIVLYLLASVFLNGGVIGRIVGHGEKITLANFLADCGKYFWRFFRVFLLSLIAYALVLGTLNRGISALFGLWTKNASTEWPIIVASNLKLFLFLLLFSIVRMFFDYVKISLVAENSRKVIKTTRSIFAFMGKRFFKAWLLYLIVALVAVVLAVIFFAGERLWPKSGFTMVLVIVLWGQIYLLSRLWAKLLFFSTEYHFFTTGRAS